MKIINYYEGQILLMNWNIEYVAAFWIISQKHLS